MAYPEVVRIFATTQEPDYDCPWQALTPDSTTGSGVVIGPGEILTGAHVVANATFLQVQKPSHPDKAVARVKAISHDCDLALLEVADPPNFLSDIVPAKIGEMPALRDEVAVVGYPVGGEEISITEGVVSRVEVQRYSHSQRRLLAVTIDAAINAGNSGGPVFGGGKVVGIAFQKITSADNIGEMVPPPIIRAFLDGIAQGRRLEVPSLGIHTQNLENPLLRRRLGLSESGIMVAQIDYGGSSDGSLEPRDVLLAIEGCPVANNGTIQYLSRYRTRYHVAITGKYVGDAVRLDVLRAGKALSIPITLRPAMPLVPRPCYDTPPVYFIYGGLVFQHLTHNFIATWNEWHKAPKEFLYHYYSGRRTPTRAEVVILTQVLADKLNVGYAHLHNESVVSIDGHQPSGMADFVSRLLAATGIVEIQMSSGGVIVLDAAEAKAATPRILERYRISKDRSAGLPT